MSELAARYAKALYSVGPDEGTLQETARAMMEDAELWEALCSPAVQPGEKKRVLLRLPLLDGHIILQRFYGLLAEKGRMELLPEIITAFEDQDLAAHGKARCVMTCAHEPEQAELDKLREALCKLHQKSDILFEIRVDPALVGGFTLEIGGMTYDKSVRGALAGLSRQLEERRMA